MDTEFDVGSYKAGPQRMRLRDIVAALQGDVLRARSAPSTCTSPTRATKRFFQERLEPDPLAAELFAPEQASTSSSASPRRRRSSATCTRKYVGQKRFSGEGGDTMIPMLDQLIEKAGAAGVRRS